MKATRLILVATVVLLLGGLLGACASDDSGGDDAGAGGAEMGAADAPESEELRTFADDGGDLVAQDADAEGSGTTDFFGAMQLPGAQPSIIKSAQLDIEVARDGLQDAVDDAIAAAQDAGGFVLTTRLDEERSGRGSLVLRVPAENFESALAALDDIGDVLGRSVSGQDVGEEFVDLEARLRNFEAQEAVLLRLMDRAETVSDTIKVQRELTGIQLEVERIRGRLRFLEDQTSLATVTVKLSEPGARWRRPGSVPGTRRSPLCRR